MACSFAACPRTLQFWCDAYCECARELNGPRALAQVILFGRRESSLAVRVVEGDTEVSVALGGGAEPTTSTDQGVIETVIEERKNDFGAAKSRLQLLAVNQSYALLAATAYDLKGNYARKVNGYGKPIPKASSVRRDFFNPGVFRQHGGRMVLKVARGGHHRVQHAMLVAGKAT